MQRRNFIRLSGMSLGALLVSGYHPDAKKNEFIIGLPDAVSVDTSDGPYQLESSHREVWSHQDVEVTISPSAGLTSVFVMSPSRAVKNIQLLWNYPVKDKTLVLGDHWERSYGDGQWKTAEKTARMPWYTIQFDGKEVVCLGVKTGCNAFCCWELGARSLRLSLDTRNGGSGVLLKERKLRATDIVTTKNIGAENVFATVRRFCSIMCEGPAKVIQPVYGINDWYFAYGNNSAALILEHTALMSPLATNTDNRPFSVVDAGWARGDVCAQPNEKFGDMHKLASQIQHLGMRPGIWTRPLCAEPGVHPNLLLPSIKNRNDPHKPFLDPTNDENIERIKSYVSRYRNWGYELIKHDYTTFDLFGRWGFEMAEDLTEPGWHFQDKTKTNAEIILHLYRSIREAAGNRYLIGCNTVSHLAAGIFELNRIGDDTSGIEWARTRKMGVNALGFRMVQHKNFYEVDGDCVGLTNKISWEKNKQWMALLAESSAPLFISAQPEAVHEAQKQTIKRCFDKAAVRQPVGEPLDWLVSPWPERWLLGGREVKFDWD